MATPKLDGIIRQLDAGETFSMTNSQYKKSTGLDRSSCRCRYCAYYNLYKNR